MKESNDAEQALWPQELRLSADGRLLSVKLVQLDYTLSATKLRVESPSAEVQGHHPSQKIIVTGKEDVRITRMEAVGHYAVRLHFSDGHDTGLYTWEYLYRLSQNP